MLFNSFSQSSLIPYKCILISNASFHFKLHVFEYIAFIHILYVVKRCNTINETFKNREISAHFAVQTPSRILITPRTIQLFYASSQSMTTS